MVDKEIRRRLKAFGYYDKIVVNLKDLKQRY